MVEVMEAHLSRDLSLDSNGAVRRGDGNTPVAVTFCPSEESSR